LVGIATLIIDSHVHFFPDADAQAVSSGPRANRLSFETVASRARKIGIDKIVQVIPYSLGTDVSESFAAAEEHADVILGVIARVDVLAEDIREKAEDLRKRPQLLGVRIPLIEDWNCGWLGERTLDRFFAVAQDIDLAVELFAPFRVLEMHDAVRRFPGIRWLIDHLGLRYYDNGDNRAPFRQWFELLELAKEPGVWIKCTYFPEAVKDLEGYPFPQAQQRFRELCEVSGTERLIWGSNFPNVRRACSYGQALDFVRAECSFLGDAQRDGILGANLLRYIGHKE
jgi:predicted TIM-barrel fold metal-dependent hydrolase